MNGFILQLQAFLLVALFAFCTLQKANASALAGEATVYEGGTVTISLADAYRRTLQKATNVSYRWSSEHGSYASVVSSTMYNATIQGNRATSSCRIYFKCSYFIDSYYRTMDFYYNVTVKSSNVSVSRISLNYSSLRMEEGDTEQLSADIYPSNATNRKVNWSSSNNSVALVSSNGKVTAISAGTATITCRAADGSGAYDDCKVSVESATVYVTNIVLNKATSTLNVGETLQLEPSISPSDATNKNVSWTSDDTSVATVSNSGLVTAKSAGKAIITCKAKDGSGKKATCSISVKEQVEPISISLSDSKVTMTEGTTFKLTVTIAPLDASDEKVTWMSDNSAIVSVDDDGLLTANSIGAANIIVTTSNNLAAVCAVNVVQKPVGETTQWVGRYKVSANHIESNATRTYPDDFEMSIEEMDGQAYITSMFGDDLKQYDKGGLRLQDNGDGTATVSLLYDILRYTGTESPLYALYVFDEKSDDFIDYWTLKMNKDGSISMGDFYVAAFNWNEVEEVWKDGKLEAFYYNLTATKEELSGISNTIIEIPNMHIANGVICLDKVENVVVYNDKGMIVFSGRTNRVDKLSKGLYIIRIGNQSKKILIN